MTPESSQHDVLIIGGGLAGLSLALQLRQRCPGIDVRVLERRSHPVPLACHKVGESTVEIGAHYFEHVLGLQQHLVQSQLRKFGFRFFFSEGERDLARVTEIGVSESLAVPSWQIDRGVFENFLGEEARRRGVDFVDGAVVRDFQLAEPSADAPGAGWHTVHWQQGDAPLQTARARWLIDGSGRAGLLKRRLGLAQDNVHPAHAVWFRVQGHLPVDDWSEDAAWRSRVPTRQRWLSTNHLVGAGYWVWLIPLSSGSHSVGIVADPRLHPLEQMDRYERALDWLQRHQPRLHEALVSGVHPMQDFAFFRRFSYDCKQVFSAQRWALAGEAGRFLDPFYSPGSDFIAIGNTYITELVARDREGSPLSAHTAIYEQIYRSFYDSTMALYVDQYPLFGDPEVLPVKIIWDYTYYWSVLAQLYCAGRQTDMASLSHLRAELDSCRRLNVEVQALLRAWGQVSQRRNAPQMLDQARLPWFAELNRALLDPVDDATFRQRLRVAEDRLRALAAELLERACGDHAGLDGQALRAAIAARGWPAAREPLLFPAPTLALAA